MKVLHVTLTSLAAAPIRIVRALQQHTDVDARLLNLKAYVSRACDEDLLWSNEKDREEALSFLAQADIVHFHHPFDFRSENNPFKLNFLAQAKKSVKCLRHFHSSPENYLSAPHYFNDYDQYDSLPHLAVAQLQERYYPKAGFAPNIIPIFDPKYMPLEAGNDSPVVAFSPSNMRHAFDYRWETKAAPEVIREIKRSLRGNSAQLDLIQNVTLDECLRRKQQCDIFIDDVNTGSYHLSALEALSMGKPTFAYLDPRTLMVLQHVTGAFELPFVNIQFENMRESLRELIVNAELRREVGDYSRAWMERFYNDVHLVNHYVEIYDKIMNGATGLSDKGTARSMACLWLSVHVSDSVWRVRKRRLDSMFFKGISIVSYFFFKLCKKLIKVK